MASTTYREDGAQALPGPDVNHKDTKDTKQTMVWFPDYLCVFVPLW